MADFLHVGIDDGLMDGSTGEAPYGDVSNGGPDEQPMTPTGNGTGYYIDPTQNSAMWGTLQQALNYAIQRDQQTMAQAHAVANNVIVPTQAQATITANRQMVKYLAIGAAIYFLMRK
ncbi:MAG: hypothetical protein V4563_15095 [Pseudomonadota bacterium]